jgi:eukaryotic-like serine/threonine-protein kinase
VGNDDQPDKKIHGRAPTLPRLSNDEPVPRPPSGSQQRISASQPRVSNNTQPRVNSGSSGQVRIGDASVSATHATVLPDNSEAPVAPARTTRDRLGQAAAPAAAKSDSLPPLAPLGEEKTELSQLPAQAAPVGDPYIGKTVADRYRVISKLGEGGMGVVYLAEHVFIEKKVAVKILSEDFARKADLVARFMQEAKAASKIGHENIIDITDFGETASGSVFFVMEFLDGADLAHHIRDSGAMPIARTRYVMNQVCRALGAAHSKGIIHRDLKPENIYLIERNGRPDFVKILDFGIAKMSSLDNEGGSRLTRTGMIFGTPEYMSPEQAKGDKPDHRVDIYAAGCILYEMLTGDVPFHAETFMGVLTKHMFETPQPPSERAPQANIAPDLEAVVLKALHKDREQRYQTMKEMALALEQVSGGDPNAAWGSEGSGIMPGMARRDPSVKLPTGAQVPATAPPISSPNLDVPAPRGRGALIGGLIAALALAAGVVGVITMKKPPPKPEVTAPPPIAAVPAPVPVAPPPAKPSAPVKYQITIKSTPAEADVFEGVERLGPTPLVLNWTESAAVHNLVVKKHGFQDKPLTVVVDRNHDYEFAMTSVHHGGSSKPTPVAKPTSPLVAPAVPAEPKPEAKPAGKLRDLKDPFAN